MKAVRIVSPGRKYGKTRVAEDALRMLRGWGVRAAAVKHAHSPPKLVGDGGRLFAAGAGHVAVLAEDGTLIQYTRAGGCCGLDESLAEAVVRGLEESFEAVIIEGFKHVPLAPAVLIVRSPGEVGEAVKGVAGEVIAISCPDGVVEEVAAEARRVSAGGVDVVPLSGLAEYVANLLRAERRAKPL